MKTILTILLTLLVVSIFGTLGIALLGTICVLVGWYEVKKWIKKQ